MPARSKLVIAGLALAGVALFVVAGVVGSGSDDDESVRRAEGIISITPARGAEVLKQEAVGVQLEPEFRLVSMRIFDTPTLAGGIDVTSAVHEFEGINRFVFAPGEGQPVEEHSADDNCVVIVIEDITRPGDLDDFDWCFTAS